LILIKNTFEILYELCIYANKLKNYEF